VGHECVARPATAEWRVTGEQFVRDNAKAVNISAMICVWIAGNLFGSHVLRST
jgi:hypothetical protein